MSKITISWSIQKDDGPKWGDSILITEAELVKNSENKIFEAALGLLKLVVAETFDVRIQELPEDPIARLTAMHPELQDALSDLE